MWKINRRYLSPCSKSYIVASLDEGKAVCAAFLDLHKAFDSLDHCLLLERISNLGVSTSLLSWFQNYLKW